MDQPRDSDSQWPKMHGTNGDSTYAVDNNAASHTGGNNNFYMNTATNYLPVLHNTNRGFHAPRFPQPARAESGHLHGSNLNTGANTLADPFYDGPTSATGASNTSSSDASNNAYRFGPRNGTTDRSFHTRGAMDSYNSRVAINAEMAQAGSDFNPNAPRYVPAAMRQELSADSIVRPESSISNRTFATQIPRQYIPIGDIAAPSPRRFHPQVTGNGPNGLGSGLSSIGDRLENGVYPSEIRGNDSVVGLDSQNGAIATYNAPNVTYNGPTACYNGPVTTYTGGRFARGQTPESELLAEVIANGETESKYDYSMKKYTMPSRQALPTMGPCRFEDTKMFAVVASQASSTNIETMQARPHQSLPPPPKPDWLDIARQGLMKPTLEEAFCSLPLVDLTTTINPPTAGVIRVCDIPYASTKNELTAFINRQAQILRLPEGSPYHAVHIMMERESGKTLDCYIEFETPQEAARVVSQMQQRLDEGKTLKVGSRPVRVRVSSQDELLRDLFPRGKHVVWSNGQPSIDKEKREYYPNIPAEGFKGFLHPEELHAMRKHAAFFDRAAFASKSPCRTWEVMISILNKYPWYATDLVSVRERCDIFECTAALTRSLCEQLNERDPRKRKPVDLHTGLLQEFLAVAVSCPGFSEKQKAWLIHYVHSCGYDSIAQLKHINITIGGNHTLSIRWPFIALSLIPGTDPKLLDYYASLFREASDVLKPSSTGGTGSLEARQKMRTGGYLAGAPMGDFSINYGTGDLDSMTLDMVAKCEYTKIEQLLGMVCRPDHRTGPPSLANSIGPDYTFGNVSASSSSEGARSCFR